MKLCILINNVEEKDPIDFQCRRSKVKVIRSRPSLKLVGAIQHKPLQLGSSNFAYLTVLRRITLCIFNYGGQRSTLHNLEEKNPIDFQCQRSKVKVKSSNLWVQYKINCWSYDHPDVAYLSTKLRRKTSIQFQLRRSKVKIKRSISMLNLLVV